MIQRDPRSFVDDSCLDAYESDVLAISKRRVIEVMWKVEVASIDEISKLARVSVNSLAAVYLELSPIGVIERCGRGLRLTSFGRKWVIKNRRLLFSQRIKVVYTMINQPEYRVVSKGKEKLPHNYRL